MKIQTLSPFPIDGEMLHAILDAIPSVCTFWNEARQVIYCNQATVDLLGLTSNLEYINNATEFSPKTQPCGTPSALMANKYVNMAFETGYMKFGWMHQKRDGTLIPSEVFLLRVDYKGGHGLVGFTEDMREKYAEREVNQSYNARLELIIDNVPLIVSLWDRNGNIIDCNKYTINMLDAPSKHEYLTNFYDYSEAVQPCGRLAADLIEYHVAYAFEHGKSSLKWIHRTRSGEKIPCDINLLRTEWLGQPILITFAQDMRVFAQLEQAVEKTKAANNAKSNFLSNMSHEIRTPLGVVIAMTAIGKSAPENEAKNNAFDKIEVASKHLLGVINSILDMSKIEAEKFELTYHSFDFKEMVAGVTSMLTFVVENKKKEFVITLDDAIPQFIMGDELCIKQVMTNLLSNAFKFTPEGGVITLNAKLHKKESLISIEISDTGIGIAQEYQPRLFHAFEQAEAGISRKYGGTGLGLAISKRIIEAMGGRIWFVSELGKGSTFGFTVPFTTGEGTPKPTLTAENDYHGAFAGYKALLAEDIEINREIVMTVLEPTGIEIDCATNGAEAVEMFREAPERYDIILMDIQMPEMDGLTATQLIRESGIKSAKTVPVIAMTANVFHEDINKCLQAGMNSHLGKPLDYDKLMETIYTFIRANRSQGHQ
jgi:signal transduction histidine kinase/CheY-like chemotaxis protein